MGISLRSLLITAFVLQAVGITSLLGYVSYRSGQQAVANVAQQLMQETGDHVSLKLDDFLSQAHRANQIHLSTLKSGAISLQNLDQLHRYLIRQLPQFPEATTFLFGSPEGDFRLVHRVSPVEFADGVTHLKADDLPFEVGVSDSADRSRMNVYSIDEAGNLLRKVETTENVDVRDRPWYQQAVATRQPGWSSPFQIGASNLLGLNAHVPVFDDAQRLQGVFSVNMSLNQLSDFLATLSIQKLGQVFIIDGDGRLIANSSGDPSYSTSVQAYASSLTASGGRFRQLAASESSNPLIRAGSQALQSTILIADQTDRQPILLTLKIAGDRHYLRAAPYQDDYGLNWLIVTVVPQSHFMEAIYANMRHMILLCGLVLLGSLAGALWLSQRITRPLSALSHVSQTLTGQTQQPSILPTRIKEVESLRRSFQTMLARLNDSFQTISASEENLSTFLEGLPIGVSVHAPAEFVFINRKGKEIFPAGLMATDVEPSSEGRQLYIAGTDQPYPFEQLPTVRGLQGETAYIDDIEVDVAGQRVPIEVYTTPIFDNAGQVRYAINAFQDITVRRQAEQARTVFNESTDALFLVNTTTLRTIDCNQRAVELFESTNRSELIDSKSHTPQQPAFTPSELEQIQQTLAEQDAWSLEVERVTLQGKKFWSFLSAKSIKVIDQTFYLVRVSDITARKQAEAALRQSEERWSLAVEGSNDGIWDHNLITNDYFLSPRCLEIVGYDYEAVDTFDKWLSYVYSEDRPALQRRLQAYLNCQTPSYTAEYRMRCHGGNNKWLLARGKALWDETGIAIRVVGSITDVTQRKRTELALQQLSQELMEWRDRYDIAAWASGQVLFEYDLVTDKDTWGPNTESVLGYTTDAMPQSLDEYISFIHPDDQTAFRRVIEHERTATKSYQLVFRFRKADGTYLWLEERGMTRYNVQGEAIQVIGYLTDITARKQTEVTLQETNARQGAILSVMPDLMYVVNANGIVLEQVTSRPEIELFPADVNAVGSSIFAINLPAHSERKLAAIKSAIATGEVQLYEQQVVSGEQTRSEEVRCVPMQRDRVLLMIRDISDRKQVEQELIHAKEVAESANQAKSAFIANISHELRSPLNAILGFAELLRKDTTMLPDHRENAGLIYRSGQHLLTIINQVLDLAKVEANRKELNLGPVNLGSLLKDLQNLFLLKAEDKGLQFSIHSVPAVPSCICTDEVKLRQILINLLDNAFKFTEEGSVSLNVTTIATLENNWIQLRFEVVDTGIGIAREEQTLLFEPFGQTQAGQTQKQGTGLGLPISREFVRLMGSEVIVQSQLGQGSTFQFEIAVEPVTVNLLPEETVPGEVLGLSPNQPRYRLLIVDDNLVNRRLLKNILSILEMDLQEAASGQEAISQWQRWQPHLIWMDLRMPNIDGLEATRQIRQQEAISREQGLQDHISSKIIAISATATANLAALSLEAGCDDFVTKPFEQAEIFAALQRQLGVSYVYADVTPVLETPAANLTDWIDELTQLPTDLLHDLENALLLGDPNYIQQLVKRVEQHNPSLYSAISAKVRNFEYQTTLTLLRQIS